MPLITNPFICNKKLEHTIKAKQSDPAFSHRDWSCDELAEVRSHVRRHYRIEQKGMCAYCKNPISLISASNAHVEHIAPKSIYIHFMFEPKNLCVVCADCNEIKRNQEVINDIYDTFKPLSKKGLRKRYPRNSSAFLIVHPHFDNWDDHLLKFGYQYIDRSGKGAYTILVCKLNRFFHEPFGTTDEFVNDVTLADQMRAYLEADSSTARTKILTSLKADMSRLL